MIYLRGSFSSTEAVSRIAIKAMYIVAALFCVACTNKLNSSRVDVSGFTRQPASATATPSPKVSYVGVFTEGGIAGTVSTASYNISKIAFGGSVARAQGTSTSYTVTGAVYGY